MTKKSITVSEALELHKETKEAWEFSQYINTELCNKFNKMKDHQRLIVIEAISSYLRQIEHIVIGFNDIEDKVESIIIKLRKSQLESIQSVKDVDNIYDDHLQ